LDERVASGELRPLTEKISATLGFEDIVGSSPDFRAALAIAAKAARSRLPILIEGEPGVGKEVVAEAVHAASPRSKRTLTTVNCGAIPSNLIESHLFGHEKGAFAGAFARHVGKVIDADGGTLFLDEVGELSMGAQIKLLSYLQTGEFLPLGARLPQEADVRIVAASNSKLLEAVEAGTFREDLYYRLNIVQLTIPPLRERLGDIPALSRHLLSRIAKQPGLRDLGITDAAMELLVSYDWPGRMSSSAPPCCAKAMRSPSAIFRRSPARRPRAPFRMRPTPIRTPALPCSCPTGICVRLMILRPISSASPSAIIADA
jgi:transcriptional regulator with PAS, ATPase and Fis domain